MKKQKNKRKVKQRRTNRENSPPQQNPAAPTAEAPLFFTASITDFATSNALSYRNNYRASDTISA